MSFTVSYNITAIDQFSSVIKKFEALLKTVRSRFSRLASSIKNDSRKIERSFNRINRTLDKTIGRLKEATRRSRQFARGGGVVPVPGDIRTAVAPVPLPVSRVPAIRPGTALLGASLTGAAAISKKAQSQFDNLFADTNANFIQLGSTAKASGFTVERTFEKINTRVGETNRRFKEANKHSRKFAKTVAGIGIKLAVFTTLPIVLMGKAFIDATSDAEETRTKFDAVFSGIEAKAHSTAITFANSFGLADSSAKKLLGNTGDLLTGFGFTSDEALNLSNQVNTLAVDLASFTNLEGGAKRASDALTRALLGERESIKSLGISILEKDVKARVDQLFIMDRTRFASDKQARAFATLQLATEQSKNAVGDYARTQFAYANQTRRTSEAILKMKEAFGERLLPTANLLSNAVERLAKIFSNLSDRQKDLILMVAGVVAVLGPLLLILGGLAFILPFVAAGFAVIAGMFAIIPLAIAAVVVALGALAFFWDDVMIHMGDWIGKWVDRVIGGVDVVVSTFAGLKSGIVNLFGGEIAPTIKPRFAGTPLANAAQSRAPMSVVSNMLQDRLREENRAANDSGFSVVSQIANSQTAIDLNIKLPVGVSAEVSERTTSNVPVAPIGINMDEAV